MRKKRKKKTKLIIASIISTIALLSAGGVGGYTLHIRNANEAWDGLIYPGVKVADVDLSSKTKEEAISLLKSKYGDAVLNKKINITAQEKNYTLEYSKLNARYDIENVVNEAFNYGKDLGMFDKNKLIKEAAPKQYDLKFAYDAEYVGELINLIEKDVNKEPVNATIKMVTRGKFEVTPDIKGYKLEKEKLENDIKTNINGELVGDANLQAPIQELVAAITAEKLNTIDSSIASYSTSYTTSSAGRSTNIELATKAINGKLLMPGETFSFNETVGQRTKGRGYQEAGVIINNQLDSGIGGGICQVSSTLYNAVLRTELDYGEMKRISHSFPSTYVPKGLDATVDWGNIDYSFKNTLDYPIFIEGYVQNKVLYFNIYSNSIFKNRTYELKSEIVQTVPTTVKTVQDPNLPEGQKEEVKKEQTGYKVKVTKYTKENGKLIDTKVLYTDYYRPIAGEVKIGTKKVQ